MYHILFHRFLSNEIEFLLFSNRPTSPKFKRAWIQLPIMMSDRNWIICWHCFIRGPILQSLINGRRWRLSAPRNPDRVDHSSDSQPTNPIWIIYRWNPIKNRKGVSPSLFFQINRNVLWALTSFVRYKRQWMQPFWIQLLPRSLLHEVSSFAFLQNWSVSSHATLEQFSNKRRSVITGCTVRSRVVKINLLKLLGRNTPGKDQ